MNNISGSAASWVRKDVEYSKEKLIVEVEEKIIDQEELSRIKEDIRNSYGELKIKMNMLYSMERDKKYHDSLIYLESIGSTINNLRSKNPQTISNDSQIVPQFRTTEN